MVHQLDELYFERGLGKFPGYHEMAIDFDPTYKRDASTNTFYVFKKDQCPSYCDRVLFKVNCK